MEKLIKLENINLKSGEKEILRDINLEISAGDFLTIIGPNGAGKSNLLKIIANLKKPNFGKVWRKKNLKIGYVAQDLRIDKNMPISVRYFLELCEKKSRRNFDEIYQKIGISKILEQNFHTLSGGEQQKVFLAKALLDQPEILILDEPTQNLDLSAQIEFYKILNELYHENKKMAILMVSHDLKIVMQASNNVLCLDKKICCAGEPKTISKMQEFGEVFGQELSEILAFYSHNHPHNHNHSHNHKK